MMLYIYVLMMSLLWKLLLLGLAELALIQKASLKLVLQVRIGAIYIYIYIYTYIHVITQVVVQYGCIFLRVYETK